MSPAVVALTMILLSPVRLYFQPDAPILVDINTTAIAQVESLKDQPLKLVMLSPTGQVRLTVAIEPGVTRVDLATLFPMKDRRTAHLWDGQTHFLQLVAGETPVGSALVVVPLRPPGRNDMAPNALRIFPEELVQLQTNLGDILIRLDPAAAPNTTHQFSMLVQQGFYTNVIFHRIVPQFVVQGGDPTGMGTGGPGFYTDLESSPKLHNRGTVSMARQGHDVNTNGSQFFICLSRAGVAGLDRQYTAFGDVVNGMEVVDKMVALPQSGDGSNRPMNPPVIKTSRLVSAPPRPLGAAPPLEVAPPAPPKPEKSHAELGAEALQLLGENVE